MLMPFMLDYVVERTLAAEVNRVPRQLRRVAGVKLSASEARALWPRILEHKWYLSERLNRDVGLHVAAIDYLENIYQAPATHQRKDSLPGRLRMMQPLNLEERLIVR